MVPDLTHMQCDSHRPLIGKKKYKYKFTTFGGLLIIRAIGVKIIFIVIEMNINQFFNFARAVKKQF